MKTILKKIIVSILKIEAKLVLKKYKPKIVAVTGSVGKTSTRDAIYTVMATSFFVRKSSKSFNTEIGVPLTILGLPNGWNDPIIWLKNVIDGFLLLLLPNKYPQWLVVEVGADRPGDIESIAKWLKPDVSVITRLSEVPVHVEFFGSSEEVRLEKSQLVRIVGERGVVVLNADDKLVSSFRNLSKGKIVTYGVVNTADVGGSNFEFLYDQDSFLPSGIKFEACDFGVCYPIQIPGVLGRQQMYAAIAALAVASALKIDHKIASEAFKKHATPAGRMKLLAGVNGSCLIDDSYNSSPIAANEALETLKMVELPGGESGIGAGPDRGGYSGRSGRKIVVLGDMLELGSHSLIQHEKLGIKAASVADEIYTIGTRTKGTYDAAVQSGFPEHKLHRFYDSAICGAELAKNLRPGDVVLVKGSQGVRMEKVVEQILAKPELAGELLVRQDKEWKKR